MSDSTTQPTFLDRLQAVLEASKAIAEARSWCNRWLEQFVYLSPCYSYNRHGDGSIEIDIRAVGPKFESLDLDVDLSDAGRAKIAALIAEAQEVELALIRGRIIQFRVDEYINDAEMNAVLTAGGWGPYAPVGATNRTVDFPRVYFAASDEHRNSTYTRRLTEMFTAWANTVAGTVDGIESFSTERAVSVEHHRVRPRYTDAVAYYFQ